MAVSRHLWRLLRYCGVPFLLREGLQRDGVTILCYHDPDPETMSRHLSVLAARYNIVALRDYIAARRAGSMAAVPKRALVVTLDDGHRGNALLTEVFERHSVRPTIFLASGIVGTNRGFWWDMVPGGDSDTQPLKRVPDPERVAALAALGHSETQELPHRSALSRAEIEDLSAVAELQSHTVFHPILSRCTDERAWTEIAQSRTDLARDYGIVVYALAYPNGTVADAGDREAALAAKAGYDCALTAVPGVNDAGTDPFRLHRIVVSDDASADEVLVRASLMHSYLKRFLSAFRRPR